MKAYFEKNLIVNNRELRYKGIFRTDELISTINKELGKLGYTKREKMSEEIVTEEGKKTYIDLRPFKIKTNYVQLMIKVKITLDHVTDVTEEVEGVKKNFERGDVLVTFDAWILSDYDPRWGMKPFVYFVKGVINKYFYKMPLEGSFPGEVAGDTAALYSALRKLLNSYKHRSGKVVKEEDVMKEVEKEIRVKEE